MLLPAARKEHTQMSNKIRTPKNKSVYFIASAAAIAAAISRPTAKCINWVMFTGGGPPTATRKGPGQGTKERA